MQSGRQKHEPTDWRFAMEQTGGNLVEFINILNGCLDDYAQSSRN
jgi:hypothetical protein